jgi:hypothetical protein
MICNLLEEEFHERVIDHGMTLQRGRERLIRGESPGKPGPLQVCLCRALGLLPCIGLL